MHRATLFSPTHSMGLACTLGGSFQGYMGGISSSPQVVSGYRTIQLKWGKRSKRPTQPFLWRNRRGQKDTSYTRTPSKVPMGGKGCLLGSNQHALGSCGMHVRSRKTDILNSDSLTWIHAVCGS